MFSTWHGEFAIFRQSHSSPRAAVLIVSCLCHPMCLCHSLHTSSFCRLPTSVWKGRSGKTTPKQNPSCNLRPQSDEGLAGHHRCCTRVRLRRRTRLVQRTGTFLPASVHSHPLSSTLVPSCTAYLLFLPCNRRNLASTDPSGRCMFLVVSFPSRTCPIQADNKTWSGPGEGTFPRVCYRLCAH